MSEAKSESALPKLIDPGKWADRAAVCDATVPLRRFPRLLDGMVDDAGEVRVAVRFDRDARGLAQMTGELATQVQATCQRCLTPVAVPLQATVDVFLLADEADAERLGEDEDYVVFADGQIDLPELLEDELILALPLVTRHEDCEPQVPLVEAEPDSEPVAKKENPFQILASLKRQDGE